MLGNEDTMNEDQKPQEPQIDREAILNALRYTSMNYLYNGKGKTVTHKGVLRYLEQGGKI